MGNTLVKKKLLGLGLRSQIQRDTENAGGGGGTGSDEGGTDGDDDAGEDSDEGGDDKDGDDKDDKGSAKPKTVPESKFLQSQRHLAESDRKKAALEEELKKLKLKDLPDAEKVAAELKEAQDSASTYKSKYESMARTNAFLRTSGDLKIAWKNSTAALKLAELADLTINDDDSVDGITDAVKDLAKEHPYLVAEAEKNGEENGKPGRKSGSPVGSKQGGSKTPPGKLSDEELRRMFPGL